MSDSMRPTRRRFIKGIAASIASPMILFSANRSRGSGAGSQGERRPNILFVMADDLGYGHLGCYGQEKIRTPHVDRLAAEGMRFTQCYAGAPVCAPSRSVLMTGMHGGHTSVRANSGGIPLLPEDVTVAEILKQAGYATGIFGKWGLGDIGTTGVPNQQGFDEFFGYLHQVHAHFYYPYFLWKGDQKFLLPGNEGGKREQYTHDVIVNEAEKFIREHKDSPFFFICHSRSLTPNCLFLRIRSSNMKGSFPSPILTSAITTRTSLRRVPYSLQ